jgi:hypothetical protein
LLSYLIAGKDFGFLFFAAELLKNLINRLDLNLMEK